MKRLIIANITKISNPKLEEQFINYCKHANCPNAAILQVEGLSRKMIYGVPMSRLPKLVKQFTKSHNGEIIFELHKDDFNETTNIIERLETVTQPSN